MASNRKVIYVYENFYSDEPNFLGTLFVENVRGRENYSFEYDADWLKSSSHYMHLDPDLQLYSKKSGQMTRLTLIYGCLLLISWKRECARLVTVGWQKEKSKI